MLHTYIVILARQVPTQHISWPHCDINEDNNTLQYPAIPCNTMQYHATPCNTKKKKLFLEKIKFQKGGLTRAARHGG